MHIQTISGPSLGSSLSWLYLFGSYQLEINYIACPLTCVAIIAVNSAFACAFLPGLRLVSLAVVLLGRCHLVVCLCSFERLFNGFQILFKLLLGFCFAVSDILLAYSSPWLRVLLLPCRLALVNGTFQAQSLRGCRSRPLSGRCGA